MADWNINNKRSGMYGLGASNRSERDREETDFYATPYIATRRLLDKLKEIGVELPHKIAEPAVGMGHIAKVLQDYGYEVSGSDIRDRKWPNTKIENFLESKTIDGDAIVSNPPYKCFSSDTEVKTNNGWKKYTEIDKNKDQILSINADTLEVEWSNIIQILEKNVKEDLINFKHKFMDILVTKDHRMFSYRKGKHMSIIDNAVPANKINTMDYIPKIGYKWKAPLIENIEIPGCYVSDGQKGIYNEPIYINSIKFAKFFGLWIADGYCRHTKNKKGDYRYTVGIKQSINNENELLSIIECIPFNIHKYMDSMNKANYEFHSKQLWEYFIKFGYSKNKYVPIEIKNNSIEVLKSFMEGYTFGDSYKSNNNTIINYSSISENLINDIQEIQLKLGYFEQVSLIHSKYYKNTLYKLSYGKSKKTNNRLYYLKEHNKNNIKYVPYKGKVFCLQLEKNHFFLLRRNGHQFISGNCASDFVLHAMEKLKEGQYCIMLLKIQFLEGKDRAAKLFKNGLNPKYCLIFPDRINCAKVGNFNEENELFESATKDLSYQEKDQLGKPESQTGGQIAYGWYVWQKGFNGITQLMWL